MWCKGGCRHRAPAGLAKLVETGRGDVPLIKLRYRCSDCGSSRTDWVVTSKSASDVNHGAVRQPKDAPERLMTAEASIEEL